MHEECLSVDKPALDAFLPVTCSCYQALSAAVCCNTVDFVCIVMFDFALCVYGLSKSN